VFVLKLCFAYFPNGLLVEDLDVTMLILLPSSSYSYLSPSLSSVFVEFGNNACNNLDGFYLTIFFSGGSAFGFNCRLGSEDP
jgi:hypothetical protein